MCEVDKDVIKMLIQKVTLMCSVEFVGIGRDSN